MRIPSPSSAPASNCPDPPPRALAARVNPVRPSLPARKSIIRLYTYVHMSISGLHGLSLAGALAKSRIRPAPFPPYRNTRVMDRRGGEPREAPRTRLFITLPNRCRFELRTVGGGNGMKVETRVGPATNKPPFQWMDGARFSSRDDAPAAETNTPEDGRVQASTIRLSQVAGSRVPVAKPYGRKTR